jgi:hypothetical protein
MTLGISSPSLFHPSTKTMSPSSSTAASSASLVRFHITSAKAVLRRGPSAIDHPPVQLKQLTVAYPPNSNRRLSDFWFPFLVSLLA